MVFSSDTVLLPGGGGSAAVGALKFLRMGGFQGKIVSTDADPLSPGLYLADVHHVLPPISDPRFWPRALGVIEEEGVSVILPTSGFDILVYGQHKEELEKRGVVVAMSEGEVMEKCVDKWLFYRLAHPYFPLPHTTLDPKEASFPCLVKPVRGKGSRGVALCLSAEELSYHLRARRDLLIQEYLPGEEYSVDVLSDLEGVPLVAVPRVRLATKEGISVKGRVVRNPEVQELCLELARFLGLKGPSCMQMKRDREGRFKFLEVNPRMGGGTIFTTLAGVNFPMVLLALVRGEKVEISPFRELTVVRYYEEMVLDGEVSP